MAENITTFRMYLASCTGNAQNTMYKNPVEISTAEDLAAACRKDHVCTEFVDNRRGSDNFIRCHAIQADCDNDNTEDPAAWITPETVAARLPGIAFYAVKSRNCDKVKHPGEPGEKSARPRYHYYFPLRAAVPKIHIIRAIMARILVLFPEFDRDGMKPAQFFYGHAEPVAEYHPGENDIAEYFIAHPEKPADDEPADDEPAEKPERIRNATNQDDFFSQNVEDMLTYISADDYGTWVTVGNALMNAGQPFDIWDRWSRSSGKYPGETAAAKKWQSFNDKGADRTVTAGTIVHMAKENGWKPDAAEAKRYRQEHRAEHTAALAALGIEYSDTLTWKYGWDGEITEVIDTKSGEILYTAPERLPTGETVNLANPEAASRNEKGRIVLTIGGYDDVEIKPIDYLFYPWFPRGKLTAVQGDSSSSKSTFMYAVGAKVSTGADLLGVPCEDPGNVLFVTIEDDASDIKIAFTDAGGSISNLRRITDREQIARLDLSSEGAAAIDTIIKQENIKLLVLDPLQQFLTGDMNKANETRPQLGRLMNIAAENNICIAFLEHMGKDTSKAALHRGVGSVDIGAATRSIIQIVTDPEDDCYKIAFTVKNNTADFHETQRAIRYQVKDHPGRNISQDTNKREHYHGHAEFIGILPEYNERLYKKAVRKADDTAEEEILLTFEYDEDPLVKTIRAIIAENPQRVFIGTDDLIQKITTFCGHCPYDQTSNKTTGIYARVDKLRAMMIDNDGIQVDKQGNPLTPKAYNWRGELFHPEDTKRTRGFLLTTVKAKNPGSQQTKI